MRRPAVITTVVVAVLLTGALAAGLVALGDDEGSGIVVGRVSRATVTEVVEAPGTVTPRASAEVTAAADAKVRRLAVRDGERVEAGQVLMRLSSPEARRALADAREADRQAAAGEVALPSADLSTQQRAADE
ncbi:MAG: biotin/lipoyl-binding protein, partial [Actinomycetes bacterium]